MPEELESWKRRMDERLDYIQVVDESFIKTIWTYAVKIKTGGIQIVYFRKYSGTKVLKKGLNLIFKDACLESLSQEVLEFDERIDAIVTDEHTIILQKNFFEKIFSFYKYYSLKAHTFLTDINQTNILSMNNFSDLLAICDKDPRKLKKLTSISKKPVDLGGIGFDKLKQFCEEWNIDLDFDDALTQSQPTGKKIKIRYGNY